MWENRFLRLGKFLKKKEDQMKFIMAVHQELWED
jgi:hypothetical protein